MKKSSVNKLIISTILVISLINLVCAVGISSPYWKGNPLKMSPGQTKTIIFNLQNMLGTEDIEMTVIIEQGNEIATLEKNQYLVELGKDNIQVPIRIEIPPDAELDQSYPLTLLFESTSGEKTYISFEVISTSPEKDTELPELSLEVTITAIIILIFLIVIISFLVKQKR